MTTQSPPLRVTTCVITHRAMTRTDQTIYIIAAILFVGAMLAYLMWPAPNLDGMSEREKCAYSVHYKNRGGSPEACRNQNTDAAVERLMRGH